MNIFTKIDFYPLSNNLSSPSSPFTLTPQLKKILIIVSIAIGFLAACFTIAKCCLFKAKPQPRDPLTKALLGFHNLKCSGIIHGIYLTTNETNLQQTRDFLTNTPQTNQGCHIGCAGWHNFDIMVLRKSAYGLILDFNPENKKLIDQTLHILKDSPTREAFAAKMAAYLDQGRIKFCHKTLPGGESLTAKEEMTIELNREGSWLSKEETYQCIKTLAMNDKIAAITEDIRNTNRLAELPTLLTQFGITIDTIYLSNICIFMQNQKDQQSFTGTLQSLIHPKTIVINCPTKSIPSFEGENISNPLQQFANLGEELQGTDGGMKFFKI